MFGNKQSISESILLSEMNRDFNIIKSTLKLYLHVILL